MKRVSVARLHSHSEDAQSFKDAPFDSSRVKDSSRVLRGVSDAQVRNCAMRIPWIPVYVYIPVCVCVYAWYTCTLNLSVSSIFCLRSRCILQWQIRSLFSDVRWKDLRSWSSRERCRGMDTKIESELKEKTRTRSRQQVPSSMIVRLKILFRVLSKITSSQQRGSHQILSSNLSRLYEGTIMQFRGSDNESG